MDERLVGGKKYRILTDAVNDVWDRISFWTKASDVVFDDSSTLEQNKPVNILKRSTTYNVNDVAYEPTAPSWAMLVCTVQGTTAANVSSASPSYSSVSPGSTVTDGGASFRICDVRVKSTLSNNAYLIPAMSLVNDLSSQLTANGQLFQFTYDPTSDKYGFKAGTSGTFIPFSGNVSGENFDVVGSSTYTVPSNEDGLYIVVALAVASSTSPRNNVAMVQLKNNNSSSYIGVAALATFGAGGQFNTGGSDSGVEIFYHGSCAIAVLELDVGDTVKASYTGSTSNTAIRVIKVNQ